MSIQTASSIQQLTKALWGVGQPSLPGGPLAGGFPTREEIEQMQLRKLRSLLEAILPANRLLRPQAGRLRPQFRSEPALRQLT